MIGGGSRLAEKCCTSQGMFILGTGQERQMGGDEDTELYRIIAATGLEKQTSVLYLRQ